ncbi:MAG TPA: hypothetical protein V6D14_30780 [Coleofasciculaceae cyanobacterium]
MCIFPKVRSRVSFPKCDHVPLLVDAIACIFAKMRSLLTEITQVLSFNRLVGR